MNIFDNIAANLSLKYENSEFYKNKLIKGCYEQDFS